MTRTYQQIDGYKLKSLWNKVKKYPLNGAPNGETAYDLIQNNVGCKCPQCGITMEKTFTRDEIQAAEDKGEKLENLNMVTLDHIFPKAEHIEFINYYDNLMVMCYKCNKAKGNDLFYYHTAEEISSIYNSLISQYMANEEKRLEKERQLVEEIEETKKVVTKKVTRTTNPKLRKTSIKKVTKEVTKTTRKFKLY